jgi:Zn ribbon nucleic-acid-binding protein
MRCPDCRSTKRLCTVWSTIYVGRIRCRACGWHTALLDGGEGSGLREQMMTLPQRGALDASALLSAKRRRA